MPSSLLINYISSNNLILAWFPKAFYFTILFILINHIINLYMLTAYRQNEAYLGNKAIDLVTPLLIEFCLNYLKQCIFVLLMTAYAENGFINRAFPLPFSFFYLISHLSQFAVIHSEQINPPFNAEHL